METIVCLVGIFSILCVVGLLTNNGFESTLEVMKLFKFHFKGGGKPSEKKEKCQ